MTGPHEKSSVMKAKKDFVKSTKFHVNAINKLAEKLIKKQNPATKKKKAAVVKKVPSAKKRFG